MNVLITGGAGFLATKLARKLLERGSLDGRAIERITLFDVAAPRDLGDARVRAEQGDLADLNAVRRAVAHDTDSVFHLAAVLSGQAEQDLDLGLRVNIDGTRALLDACRVLPRPPKFVFTSSIAAFGGPLPDPVPDDWPLTPQSSYGAQKAIGELLVNDMSRRGCVDARCLRLPTITVRPGKPNRAASSFASGIIREPLAGEDAICPVTPDTRMWVSSPKQVIENIVLAHDVPASRFAHTRSMNVPGLSVRVRDMVSALRDVAGEAVAARVKWEFDPNIARIVESWPAAFQGSLGRSLGMTADENFQGIVRAYLAEDAPTARYTARE